MTKQIDASSKSIREQVEHVIEMIRPTIQSDGGDVQLVDVIGDVVQIRFLEACSNCPSSDMTLRDGLEANITRLVPQIKSVVAVK